MGLDMAGWISSQKALGLGRGAGWVWRETWAGDRDLGRPGRGLCSSYTSAARATSRGRTGTRPMCIDAFGEAWQAAGGAGHAALRGERARTVSNRGERARFGSARRGRPTRARLRVEAPARCPAEKLGVLGKCFAHVSAMTEHRGPLRACVSSQLIASVRPSAK